MTLLQLSLMTKKVFSLISFLLGGLLVRLVVSPLISLASLVYPLSKERTLRATISLMFNLFIQLVVAIRLYSFSYDWKNFKQTSKQEKQEKRTEKPKGRIICANHPSLLDIVLLISRIPNADCVVNCARRKNPLFFGLAKRLYIPNSLEAESLLEKCRLSLERGNHLIIFPEGSRTVNQKNPQFKRGAAQLALYTGCEIQPIHIESSDRLGFGKGASFFARPPKKGWEECRVTAKRPIPIDEYRGVSRSIAARRLTERLLYECTANEEEIEIPKEIASL